MRVLMYVPNSRNIGRCLASIHNVDTAGHEVRLVFDKSEPLPGEERYDTITRKYQAAARMARDGGYEALMTLEDDIIVPPDALERLAALEVDVAYGLTVVRNAPFPWSAAALLDERGGYKQVGREYWGQVVPVIGCGLFCTLIRREVWWRIPFQRRGPVCCDWYFALDCDKQGFTQKADLGVVCGHVVMGKAPQVLYPDPMTGYRKEPY